jgi:hypothetical protein
MKGLPGVFPPVIGNSPILSDNHAIAYIIVHGLDTENGAACPPHMRLGSREIIKIAEYIGGLNGNTEKIKFTDLELIKEMGGEKIPDNKEVILKNVGNLQNQEEVEESYSLESDKIEKQKEEYFKKTEKNQAIGNVIVQKDGSLKVVIFPKQPYDISMQAEIFIIEKTDKEYRKLLQFIGPPSADPNNPLYVIPSFLKERLQQVDGADGTR